MYVCLCKGITDTDIKNQVEQGCSSLRDLKRDLGLGGQCGRCVCHAHEVLHESLATKKALASNTAVLAGQEKPILYHPAAGY